MRCIYVDIESYQELFFKEMIKKKIKYELRLKILSFHEARVIFLKCELNDVHSILERYKKKWSKNGCTLMSNRSMKNMSITNFTINSLMRTIFLKLVDSSSYFKDAMNLFSLIDGVIDEIGEENIVQIITDSLCEC
jgi:Protein of unknown function (DUF 659)